MKKICIIILLAALYVATNALPAATWMRPHDKVALKEIANKPDPKSPAICESVEVEQHAASIEIQFKASLGILNVEVTNQAGATVFQQKLDATAGSSLFIATQSLAKGIYTIRLINDQGNGCEGQFEIN